MPKKREPMAVTRAYERVCGMERAHSIVSDAWRERVWRHRLLRQEDMEREPVAKALFDIMMKIDELKRPDDDLWRNHRYPTTAEEAGATANDSNDT